MDDEITKLREIRSDGKAWWESAKGLSGLLTTKKQKKLYFKPLYRATSKTKKSSRENNSLSLRIYLDKIILYNAKKKKKIGK